MLSNSERAFTPTEEESHDGTHSRLTDWCMGDWSWRPGRCEKEPNLADRFPERLFTAGRYTQGAPRPTTRHTHDHRIAQVNIPPEKQARKWKTGDAPPDIQSTMKPIWDMIHD